MKEKNKKQKYVDDGHTIYNMDVDGMPHRRFQNKEGIDVTKKERRAIIGAALLHYLPILLGVLGCFGIAFLLVLLWLR